MAKLTTQSVLTSWVIEFHQCGDYPEQIGIYFDCHAEDEDGNTDESQYCYCVLVHKDSATADFSFNGHEHEHAAIATYYVWINDDNVVDCISDGEAYSDIKPFSDAIVEIERRYQEA